MANMDTRTGNKVGDIKPYLRAEFVAFVEKNHVIQTMPEVTNEAFELLMEAKELAGHIHIRFSLRLRLRVREGASRSD